MHYIIYKTINTINNKIYIGKHQTYNLDDDYLGSGKILKRAINKYGIESFTKEVIYIFKSKKEMDDKEKSIVDIEFINRKDTYNVKLGGEGGWDHLNLDSNVQKLRNLKSQEKQKYLKENDKEWRRRKAEKLSQACRKAHKEGRLILPSWLGRKHKEDSKLKIGKANSEYQRGEGNSQYGTCWIYNENLKENKKIKKEDVQEWLDKEWAKGRKVKF